MTLLRCRLMNMCRIKLKKYTTVMAVLVFACVIIPNVRALETFPVAPLTIETKGGAHKFTVEVATTRKQLAQGLMLRRKMAADAGMVFVYKHTGQISMWMKNTLIPLDMLFIDSAGKITKIVARTTPMSQEIIASDGPIRVVLELNSGMTSRLSIKTGDWIKLPGVFD